MTLSRLAVVAALGLVAAACDKARPIETTGNGSLACTTCHGDANRAEQVSLVQAAPPATVANASAGAHMAHLHANPFRAAATCDACHVVPTSVTHTDGVVSVTFPGLSPVNGRAPAYDPATGTCSNVSCHGAGRQGAPAATPPWTSTTPLTCSSCHGNPPASHAPGSTACSTCHSGTVAPDGTILVGGGLHMNGNVEAVGGHPAGWADKAQHGYYVNANGLSSCKSCHGANLTGGTGPSCASCHDAVVAGWDTSCTFCHGSRTSGRQSPPVDTQGRTATSSLSVGAHDAHVGTALTAAPITCAACHPSRTSPITDAAHIDGDGVAEVAFGALASTGMAQPPTWNRASPTCAVYCHGVGVAGGPAASPAWTSTTNLGCGSCHGNPPPAPHTNATNCNACHPNTVAANGTIVPNGLHMNGQKEATSGHPAGWADPTVHGYSVNANGIASCKTCHGATLTGGTGPSCASCHGAGWDTTCNFCHGNANHNSPPVDTQGRTAVSNLSVGGHDAHVGTTMTAAPITCAVCHPARSTSVITDTAHIDGNGVAEVAFTGLAVTGLAQAPTWNRASPTCAVYCHGVGVSGGPTASLSWTSPATTQLGCGSCHGNPPASHSAGSTNCNTCHPNTVAANGTIVPNGLHMDGQKQATSAHPAGWSDPTVHGYSANRSGLSSCKTCHGATLTGGTGPSCASCHGNGWDTTCNFCHGNASHNSPPVDTQGGTSTANVSVGAHDAHVGSTISASIACGQCHPARTTSVVTDANHIDGNGVAEVTLAAIGGVTGTYSRASATSASCSSTYCHGNFTGGANGGAGVTMSWTSTANLACNACHSMPNTSTRRHSTHSAYGCNECHGAGYSSTAVNAATHVNGVKNVPFSSSVTSPSPPPTYNGSCTLTCHSKQHTGFTW